MRSGNGPRRLLVYCSDHRCSHPVVVDAAPWGDDVRLSDLEPKFTCKACGRRGADVRPLFKKAGCVRAEVALQLLVDLAWLVETSDADRRSYLARAWLRGRLRSSRLDLDQAAARHSKGSWIVSI